MANHFSERSNLIHLTSYQVSDIFTCLLHGANKTDAEENFIFQITENKTLLNLWKTDPNQIFELEVIIPRHSKFPQNDNRFENFTELFNFFDSHKMKNGQLPYQGEDIA